jgi:hypothetical protein
MSSLSILLCLCVRPVKLCTCMEKTCKLHQISIILGKSMKNTSRKRRFYQTEQNKGRRYHDPSSAFIFRQLEASMKEMSSVSTLASIAVSTLTRRDVLSSSRVGFLVSRPFVPAVDLPPVFQNFSFLLCFTDCEIKAPFSAS